MPTTKTAEKEMRTAERRQQRNKSIRSQTKTSISKAEDAITAGNADTAKAEVKKAIQTVDREAEAGKIHANKAARHKSRLMKKLNKVTAPKTEKK